jgi:hypothetical protein
VVRTVPAKGDDRTRYGDRRSFEAYVGSAPVTSAAGRSIVITRRWIGNDRPAGHPATFAATVAGLLGVLSVTGRLATTGLQRRIRPATVVAAVFAVQALAAALPLTGHSRIGAVIGVIGFGVGFGVATIARPDLLAARYGTTGYATMSGLLIVPMTLAKAGAPLAAAYLYGLVGGYTPVLAMVALGCAVAAAVLSVGSPHHDRPSHGAPTQAAPE